MKKLLYSFILLLSYSIIAQDKEIQASSKINSVDVYLNGALIHRKATVAVTEDRTKIRFEGLSDVVDPQSIQVGLTSGKARIISISHENDFLTKRSVDKRVQRIKDSLEILNLEWEKEKLEMSALLEEKRLLTDNTGRIGSEKGVNVTDLASATAYYRSKLTEINSKLISNATTTKKLVSQINLLTSQLGEIEKNREQPTSTITVIVDAPAATQLGMDLNYLVQKAGWAPKYDIRTTGAGSEIALVYRAQVYNLCGENWEKVNLTLSTAEPSRRMEKPTLEVWGLTFSSYNKKGYSNQSIQYKSNGGEGRLNQTQMRNDANNSLTDRRVSQEYSEVEVSELAVEFNIKELSNIPSDGIPYLVDVNEYKLQTSYNYYCVPKVSKDVFLIAKVIGWESLNLIEGDANVYMDETYVGNTYIDTYAASDTLELFLGVDKKVSVARVKKKDFNEERFIGSNRKESFQYNIDVRNNHAEAIDIQLVDQVPIAQESEIEVTIEEISGARRDELSGKLTWNLKIEPSQTKKLALAFTVKYPKNKTVFLRQSRKVVSPKFR